MEEVKTYTFKNICSKIGSGATPKGGKDAYKGGNTALIRSQNVLDFSLSRDGLAYINEEQAQKLDNVSVSENDVLLNITGDSVARVCLAPSWALPARVNQHVSIIRGKSDIVLNCYLLYYLQYKKSYLLSLSQGGATRNALTKKMIEDIEIPLPTISYQEKVISILSALDDKIELNRRINDNLEQQAQALFKAWFVDFEPFKDGKFVDSELGKIPEGWKVGNLLDIAIVFDSLRKPLSSRERNAMAKIYPYYGATSLMDYVEDFIFDGTYLLMGEDGSVVNENGHPYLQYVFGRFWVNNHAHVLQGKNGYTTEMLHCLLYKKNISSIVTGAVQAKISQTNMKKILVVIPTKDICTNFSNLIAPIYAKVRNIESENSKLSKIRDILLPRLMSGELNVNTITE